MVGVSLSGGPKETCMEDEKVVAGNCKREFRIPISCKLMHFQNVPSNGLYNLFMDRPYF